MSLKQFFVKYRIFQKYDTDIQSQGHFGPQLFLSLGQASCDKPCIANAILYKKVLAFCLNLVWKGCSIFVSNPKLHICVADCDKGYNQFWQCYIMCHQTSTYQGRTQNKNDRILAHYHHGLNMKWHFCPQIALTEFAPLWESFIEKDGVNFANIHSPAHLSIDAFSLDHGSWLHDFADHSFKIDELDGIFPGSLSLLILWETINWDLYSGIN